MDNAKSNLDMKKATFNKNVAYNLAYPKGFEPLTF